MLKGQGHGWWLICLLTLLLTRTGVVAAIDSAPAPLLIEKLQTRLAQPAILRGRFEQHKSVAGFTRPLRAEGQFLLWRGHGLAWDTTAPFPASLVLTPRQLRSRQGDGPEQILDARTQAGIATTNQLLLELLGGEFAGLQERFLLTGEVPAQGEWRVRLQAQDPALAQVLSEVHLQGDAHVMQVELLEANGDRTQIRFSALQVVTALSGAEEARFAD